MTAPVIEELPLSTRAFGDLESSTSCNTSGWTYGFGSA